MGKSSKVTVGYWYHPAFHMGISLGPIDALLEIRGGDLTAWSGNLGASGIITVNAPNLWGGEKDQGGIAGDFELMMGEPTQQPNAYLTQTFGNQQPAWRGLTSIVFKGGRYGAMNPYPQKISYKGLKITHGWDGDPGDGSACWYSAKAGVPLADAMNYDAAGWKYTTEPPGSTADYSATNYDDSGWNVGAGGFGDIANSGLNVGTFISAGVDGAAIWLRRKVAAAPGAPYTATVYHDDGAWLWWNGVAIPFAQSAGEFSTTVTIPGNLVLAQNTVALKVLNAIPFGQNTHIFAALDLQQSAGLMGMNPAHVLYYARTQQHMGREPVLNIDDASHRVAADWFYSERFGICWDFDPSQESVDAFVARIEKVSGCSQSRSPVDGKWYLDVANGVYDLASLPVITDDDILDFQRQPTTLDSAVNSVSVQYFDPQQKTDVTTPPVEALALVNAFGTIHQDVTYKEIPTSGLAARVAQRDLQGFVTPTNGFEITTARKPYAWRRGNYFRLQSPKRGIADMVCILGDIDTGTLKSGAIKITATQDIYSLPAASFVQQEPGVDPRPPPFALPIIQQTAFEAPYIEVSRSLSRADLAALPADVGYLMTVAADPSNSRDYAITVSTDGGNSYAGNVNGVWCPTALIVEGDTLPGAAPRTAFTLAGSALLSSVVVGSAALWDAEICRVDAIDASANTLTLGRGCADTVPTSHAANSRVWFFDGFTGTDATEYTDGETIDVKLLTNTGSQQLDPSLATVLPLTFQRRQMRPYPPAAVSANGKPWYAPDDPITSPLALAWVGRNRITQADQLIDSSAAGVAEESGTTYNARFYGATGTLLATQSAIAGNTTTWNPPQDGTYTVQLETQRDGLVSAQMYAFPVTITGSQIVDPTLRGCFAKWNMSDGAGTSAPDSSGNGYNLSLVGSGTVFGQASILPNGQGTSALLAGGLYFQLPSGFIASALKPPFSIVLFCKFTSVAGTQQIFCSAKNGINWYANGGVLVCGDAGVSNNATDARTLAANTSYLLALTCSTTGDVHFYINTAASAAFTGALNGLAGLDPARIGDYPGNPGNYPLLAYVQRYAMCNVELSASEISDFYSAFAPT